MCPDIPCVQAWKRTEVKGAGGSLFHTTFAYNKESDSWEWRMDGEENGTLRPFARVKLTRK